MQTPYKEALSDPIFFYDSIIPEFSSMLGENFRIPEFNGKPIDFHQAFVEVTSRGAIKEVRSILFCSI